MAPAPPPAISWLLSLTNTAGSLTSLHISLISFVVLLMAVAFVFYADDILAFIGLLLCAFVIFTVVVLEPKSSSAPPYSIRWFLPGPQVISVIPFCLYYVAYIPVRPPPTGFTLEPMACALGFFIGQIHMGARGLPMTTRLFIGGATTLMHSVNPIWSIGFRGPLVIFVGHLTGLICGAAIKMDAKVMRYMVEVAEMNRRADSRLNHVIKGQCGGAAAILTAWMHNRACEAGTDNMLAQDDEMIQHVVGMLRQATHWCHQREVFLQLEEGIYRSTMTKVKLESELKSMLAIGALVDAVEEVEVDAAILRLLVQEVGTNANKFTAPGEPIQVKARVEEEPGSDVATLHISIANINRPGVPHLTPEECELVFHKGHRKCERHAGSAESLLSNGLGLSSVRLAARSIGGDAYIEADKRYTTVHIVLPAVCCHKPLESTLREPQMAVVERPQVPPRTLSTAAMATIDPPSPVCIGIDDMESLRKLQAILFSSFIKADMSRSGSLGAHLDEVLKFVDVVMGKRTLSLEPADLPPADIVLLDENIDIEGVVSVKGSDLALELKERGFNGVVCILSGASPKTLKALERLPQVDFAFAKDIVPTTIAKKLLDAHASVWHRSHGGVAQTVADGPHERCYSSI